MIGTCKFAEITLETTYKKTKLTSAYVYPEEYLEDGRRKIAIWEPYNKLEPCAKLYCEVKILLIINSAKKIIKDENIEKKRIAGGNIRNGGIFLLERGDSIQLVTHTGVKETFTVISIDGLLYLIKKHNNI